MTDPQQENIHGTILRDVEMSSIPLVNRMLQNANWARRLEILLVQADIKMKTGPFVMMMLVIGVVTALALDMILHRPFVGIACVRSWQACRYSLRATNVRSAPCTLKSSSPTRSTC